MDAKRTSQRDAEASMWTAFEDFVVDGKLLSFTDHAGLGGAAFLCSGLIFLLPTGRKLSSSEDSSDEGRDKID